MTKDLSHVGTPFSLQEHPIAFKTKHGEVLALVKEGQRYVFTQCLENMLQVSTYDSIQREPTVMGGTNEYFRPGKLALNLFVEPGDEMEILEVDDEHGFVHALVKCIRQQRYEIDRVIPLREANANAHSFLVKPYAEGERATMRHQPDLPINDESMKRESATA